MGISVTCTELRPLTVYWDASMANMPVVFSMAEVSTSTPLMKIRMLGTARRIWKYTVP